jgi:hypothetical protein
VSLAAPFRVPRTHQGAAKLALAASSVAPVAYGYERSLRPRQSGFSRLVGTSPTKGDR